MSQYINAKRVLIVRFQLVLPEGMTEIKLRDSDEAYTVSRPPSFV